MKRLNSTDGILDKIVAMIPEKMHKVLTLLCCIIIAVVTIYAIFFVNSNESEISSAHIAGNTILRTISNAILRAIF